MKLPTLTSRFWVALGTLAAIAVMFAYYLLVYVEMREEKVRADKYRALARYGANMTQTRADYEKAILRIRIKSDTLVQSKRKQFLKYPKSWKNEVRKFLDAKDNAVRKESLKNGATKCCCCDWHQGKEIHQASKSSEADTLTEAEKNSLFWKLKRDSIRIEISEMLVRELKGVRYDGYLTIGQCDSLQHRHFDRIHFKFPTNRANWFSVYSIATKDFVYRPPQFDEFFIIKDFERSHEHDSTLVYADETYQTFQNRIDLQHIDSLLVRHKGLRTSRFGEVELADKKYKLFVHRIKFTEGENWLLCGLIEKSNYNYLVRSVSPLVITASVLILLFLIVAMPILKPLIMNRYERLGFVNVWLAGFSVAYGGSLLFLLLWALSHSQQSKDEVDRELKSLSSRVKSNFENELFDIYEQLNALNTKISPALLYMFWCERETKRNTRSYNMLFANIYNKQASDTIKRILSTDKLNAFPYPNYLLWIDMAGTPKVTVTTTDMPDNSPMPNLSERKYYSRVIHDSLWNLPTGHGSVDYSKRFALQSIQSWTSHQPEAGFGIPYNKGEFRVLAMSTRLSSVMDPALKTGFGFCIIDDTGEVWFHSDTKRNHQENIFQEVEHHGKLTATVMGRGAAYFNTEYHGERTRMYVQPLTDIPLYLVVFHDKRYQRTPVMLTIFFAFAFLLSIIALQVFQLALLYICEYRSGKLRRKGFFLRLLRPSPTCSKLYRTSITAQATILAICIVIYSFNHFVMIVGLITLPAMRMVFHQVIYNNGLKGRTLIFSLVSLLLIISMNVAMSNLLSTSEIWFATGQQLLFATVLIAFALYAISSTNPNHGPDVPTSESSDGIHKNARSYFLRTYRKFQRWRDQVFYTFPNNYYAFILLISISCSIFPVIYFYKLAHWEETLLWNKFLQLEERETRIARERMMPIWFKSLSEKKELLSYAEKPGNYLCEPDHFTGCVRTWGDTLENKLFRIWPQLTDPVGISSAATFNNALDDKWTWRKSNDTVEITYTQMRDFVPHAVSYTAPVATFNPFNGRYGPWIIVCSAISIFVVWRVIRFCAKYFFGVGLIPEFEPPSTPRLIAKLMRGPCHLYIVEPPGCSKGYVKVLQELPHIKVIQLFEDGMDDHRYNQQQLALIGNLAKNLDQSVAVVAHVHPTTIADLYQMWITDASNTLKHLEDKKSDEFLQQYKLFAEKVTEYRTAVRQWSRVLSSFEIQYHSIQPARKDYGSALMNSELNASVYLQNAGDRMKHLSLPDDDFIIHVEQVVQPYYNALWNSFSVDEKLLLYDLAQDRFVNLKNHRMVKVLMQKGIVIRDDDGLRIMNRSFSNYIINIFQADEEVRITYAAQTKGSWGNVQLVFIMLLISIVTFIALAQKEFLGNINAIVVTATSAVALFSQFGGLFRSDKSKA